MRRRTPLRRFGRRAQREAAEWYEARLLARTAALVSIAGLKSRPNLFECARCSKHVEHVDVHHLVSKARGGGHDVGNLAALCRPCHAAVHDYTADDWPRWIRSRRLQQFRNEVPLEGTTAWETATGDLDGGAA